MKKPDWNKLVPLGIDAERLRLRLFLMVGLGGALSIRFLYRYADAVRQLYTRRGNDRVLIPGAKVPAFGVLLQDCFNPMAFIGGAMLLGAVGLYLYHYQGSRSIYTMKRLPDRWELWRRCLTVPIVMCLWCIAVTLALTGLYYLAWRFLTPAVCLPL